MKANNIFVLLCNQYRSQTIKTDELNLILIGLHMFYINKKERNSIDS